MRGAALAIAAFLCAAPALAQQPGTGEAAPTPAIVTGAPNGHMYFIGGAVPSMSGGTMDDGSTDNQGAFVASASSGTLTFGAPYLRPPFCDVSGYTAAPVYTVTTLAIVFSTIASTNRYTWQCFAKPGG